ncbi:hypothetical protein Tco_0742022 [Tanacetum coccineum]
MSSTTKSHDPFLVEELQWIWKMCLLPLMLRISIGISRGSAFLYLCASAEHGWPVAFSPAGMKNVNCVSVTVALKLDSEEKTNIPDDIPTFPRTSELK